MKYAGKGPMFRAEQSAKQLSNKYKDSVKNGSIDWTPASSHREAFKAEAKRLEKISGPDDIWNYNQRNSPGKKYIEEDGF